jgi:hypothetical protein
MKNTHKSKVFHFQFRGHSDTNPELVRILLHPEFTKVDFGYSAHEIYKRGGWIRMSPDTFIEVIETKKRYVLKTSEGIPIAPEHHYFESKKDWCYYSLLFPPIPLKDCTINIVEIENGISNDFNYYGIDIKMENGIEVLYR